MQIKLPEPFLFEESNRAVLLLHGFTGNSADVRQMGVFYKNKVILVMHLNMKDMQLPQKKF